MTQSHDSESKVPPPANFPSHYDPFQALRRPLLSPLAALAQSLTAGVGLLILAASFWLFFWPQGLSPRSASNPAALPAFDAPVDPLVGDPTAGISPVPTSNPAPSLPAISAEKTRQQMDLSLAKTQQREALGVGKELRRLVQDWNAEIERWDQEVVPLLTNADGKTLAAKGEWVLGFRATFDEPRPGTIAAEEMAVTVNDLLAPLETALADPADASLPPREMVPRLRLLQSQAKEARDRFRSARQEIQALVTLAKQQGASSNSSLQEAIARMQQQEALQNQRAKALAAEEAKLKAAALDRETEALKIVNDAKLRKKQAELDDQERQAKAEKERLRKLAHAPEVQKYLGNFFKKGFTQPKFTPGIYGLADKVRDEGPVSLKALQTAGCLSKDTEGLRQLNLSLTGESDRPHWDFGHSPVHWTKEGQSFLKKAQDLLIQLGPILVEEGMLAP